MKQLIGMLIGVGMIALGVTAQIAWLGVCFGTVILGVILLLFAPRILFFPTPFLVLPGVALLTACWVSFKEEL